MIDSRRETVASSTSERSEIAWISGIILVGFVLACCWALRFPMFLAPDEDNHYDYALTVATLGRGLRPDEANVARDTHPVVEYLVTATKAREQKLDRDVHADPGYGSRAYFAKLDAGAPKVDSSFGTDRQRSVPYIARIYPIGYYALLALAINLARALTHGSVSSEFFAARLVSCVLLVPTLFFGWLALRELGFGRRRARVIVAISALLPLTTWTFGSVQPDTLAAALTAPIVYIALRLRSKIRTGLVLILASLLAMISMTKFQYALADGLAVGAMLLARMSTNGARRTLVAFLIACIGAPALAIASVLPTLETHERLHALCDAVPTIGSAGNVRGKLAFVREGLDTIVHDGLGDGNGLRSYWLAYSAYRNRTLVIINENVSDALLALFPAATSMLALCFLATLLDKYRRIVRLARRGLSAPAIARLVTGNVLVNAYLAFFVIFVLYEIDIGGFIPVQGRYWIPYVSAVTVVTTTVAPRIFGHRVGRAIGRRLATVLLIFVVLGAASQFSSLHEAFYTPSPTSRHPAYEHRVVIRVRPNGNREFRIAGFAVDFRTASALRGFRIVLDHAHVLAYRRTVRHDLMCEYERTLASSGFETAIERRSLRPGMHQVEVISGTTESDARGRVEAEVSFST